MEIFGLFYALKKIEGEKGGMGKNLVSHKKKLHLGYVGFFVHRHRFLLNITFGTNYFNFSLIRELEFPALFFNEEKCFKKNMTVDPDQ